MLGELSIVLGILLVSQGIQNFFNLSIPATIIGMIILIFMLSTRILKLKWVENITDLLLGNLSILFIPAGVGIMNELHLLSGNVIPVVFILFVTTIIVIVTTGYTVQYFINLKRTKKNEDLFG